MSYDRRRSTDRIEDKLDRLLEEQMKLRSFMAGVSAAFSFVAFAASLFFDYIKGE